jgi:hypothetical protein
MCSRQKSGAAVISEKSYSSSGEFEFKIRPSLSEGVVTVLGLADDSVNSREPYMQLIFDTSSYTKSSFAIVLDGGSQQKGIQTFMVNVSDTF